MIRVSVISKLINNENNNMKKAIILSLMIAMFSAAFSQNAIIINKTNGSTITIAIDEISKITFGNITETAKPSVNRPIYIIGDVNSWNNSDITTMLALFKENSNSDNAVYTYTGYLPVGYFKFLPEEALNSYKALCFKSEGKLEYLEQDGGAFYNAEAGYKTISVNVDDMAYSISNYDASGANEWQTIGVIGEFCGWANEPKMTQYSAGNKHIWSLELTLPSLAEGATHPVKFRANESWGSRWAANDPEAVPFGKAIFLTKDEYDPNIVLHSGGNYHIVFNDLTGHYIFIKK
jgi:hypothetical protein